MSRAVSPRLEILRRPERGHRFCDERAHFKPYATTWDIFSMFYNYLYFVLALFFITFVYVIF